MYNQEIKEGFLKAYSASGNERSGCRAMFETTSSYEESIGKDLSEMTSVEVIDALRPVIVGAYKTAANVQSRIKAYVNWCHLNCRSLSPNLSLLAIEIDDIDASEYFKKTIFKNEDELIFELETVRRFEDGFTEGLILLFAWIGIEQKDALSVKIHDVDLEKRTVFVQKYNQTISFSERIADVFKIYEKTKEGSRSAGGSNRPVFRDDSYHTYIRKYCPSAQLGVKPLDPSNIRKSVNDINQLYVAQGKESRLRNGNIVASGALYRVRLLEESGVDVFSFKNRQMVIDAFGVSAKLHEIHWMYKNYKRAFKL